MILGYTKKSFFNAVLHSNADPSLREYAKTMIDFLNYQSEKQRARRAARYEYYNRPLMVEICHFLMCKKDTPALAVANYCNISVQKAVGLLRKMARDDKLIKISHHYKSRNTYDLAEGITFYR
jgi:hypothetical protein